MIDIVYTVEQPEFVEAQKLFSRQRLARLRIYQIVLWCVILIACFLFFWRVNGIQIALIGVGAIAVLAACVHFLTRYLLRAFVFRKQFTVQRRLLTNIHLSIDHSGIVSELPGISHGTLQWQAFTGWTEGPSVFVLFLGYLIRPIPKRVLTDAQQAELCALLEKHIGPKDTKRNPE